MNYTTLFHSTQYTEKLTLSQYPLAVLGNSSQEY